MSTKNQEKGYVALLGWSLNAIDAVDRMDRRYVVIAPPWAEEYATKHSIPYIPWNFERLNDRSMEIAQTLQDEGVDVAIPLFEETVEWAGAINAVLMKNPRLMGQSLLFRDKALMKRRAQLGGIRVGIFEEAHDKSDVIHFLKRVNQALLKLDGDPNDPIHLKAFDKAGCLGHRVVRTPDDVQAIPEDEFPFLMESHLDGWEFAVEAWIHDRKIRFLNISEYVTLGYSVFVPASPELEKWRPRIEEEIEKLIETFDIDFGFIHPEYFVTKTVKCTLVRWLIARQALKCLNCLNGLMALTPIRAWYWHLIHTPQKRKLRHFSPKKWWTPKAMPGVSGSIRADG